MSRLNVNPTRMELTRLKKSLQTALRGHKLLKDKRDELMKRFLELVREDKELRQRVGEKLSLANEYMSDAAAVMKKEILSSALLMSGNEITVEGFEENIMSVAVPRFKINIPQEKKLDLISYGYADTTATLDEALKIIQETVADMIRIAECEKAAELLAGEIERTRRRVNALEYVIIPDYRETVRYISMKLEEAERGNTTRLLKVKDIVIKEKYQN